jgi:putative ABC transport system permease protein
VSAAIHLSTTQVAASLALVAVAIGVSVWQRADLEREIAIAVARSAVQLIAVGYLIDAIFASDRFAFVVVLLGAMVVFGAFTARHRARGVPGALWPLLIALALAAATTIGLVVALGVFKATRAISYRSAAWSSATP